MIFLRNFAENSWKFQVRKIIDGSLSRVSPVQSGTSAKFQRQTPVALVAHRLRTMPSTMDTESFFT
jgi:hypothetical protein